MSVSAEADAVGAHDGQPVAGQEELGAQGRHAAQRRGPLRRVALHLLGIAGVGLAQMKRSPQHSDLGGRDPGHGVVVGLALLVAQAEVEAADRRGRSVSA